MISKKSKRAESGISESGSEKRGGRRGRGSATPEKKLSKDSSRGGLAEETIQESEEKFRSIFNNTDECLIYLSRLGKILDVNEKAMKVFGGSREELVGKQFTHVGIFSPRDIPSLMDNFRNILTGKEFSLSLHIENKTGQETHLECSAYLVKAGKEPRVMVVARDTTERENAKEKIRHLNLVLRAISNVNQLIVRENDRDRLLESICVSLIESRGYHSAWIAILDDFGELVTTAEAGLGKDFLPLADWLERGELPYCGMKAHNQSDTVMIEDPPSTCGYCPLSRKYSGNGAMTVLLEYRGEIFGLMSVSASSDVIADEEEHQLFKEIATDIALALHNIEIDERRNRAERALRESEERFRNIFESANDCFIHLDLSGKIQDLNEKTEQVLGMPRKELIGKHFARTGVFSSRDVPMIMGSLEQVLAGKESLLNLRIRNKKGQEIHLECSANLMKTGDKALGMMIVARDITEAKQAELAIKESEEEFRGLAEGSPNMIFINKNGRVVYANRKCEEMMGYGADEFCSPDFDFFALVAPESRDLVMDSLCRHIKGEEVTPYECTFITKKRKRVEAILATKLISYDGEMAVLGVVTDITERKRAEEALKESEERYRDLFENANDLIQSVNAEGKFEYVNKKWLETLGYSRKETMELRLSDIIRKDQLQHCMQLFERVCSGEALDRVETVFVAKDGREIFVEGSVSPRIKDGKFVATRAIFRDITERKLAGEALKKSEREYRDLVDSALVGVYRTNLRGDILFVNEALVRMFEFDSPEEMMSEGVIARYTDPKRREALIGSLKEKGRVSTFEVELLTRTDKTRNVLLGASLCGDVISGMIMDITDRKKAEEALQESEERYSTLVENTTDGIIIIQDGVLRFVNTASVSIVGYTPGEMLGADFLRFVAPDYREVVTKRYADRMVGKEVPAIYELALLGKDGTILPVEINANLIEYEGKPADLVSIRDISERKQVGKELNGKIQELERYKDVTIGRELKMVELKKRIEELKGTIEEA